MHLTYSMLMGINPALIMKPLMFYYKIVHQYPYDEQNGSYNKKYKHDL